MSNFIILLNGASSSGKSSIVKELQSLFVDEPLLNMGADRFMSMIPKDYQGFGKKAGCMWAWEKVQGDSGEIVTLKLGDLGEKFVLGVYRCIKMMYQDGFNVIVDDVWMEKELLNKIFADILSDCKVYFIGVNCDLQILQEREIARNNRVVGSTRGQHELVHQFCEYDFVVDTSQTSSRDCALKIKEFIDANL